MGRNVWGMCWAAERQGGEEVEAALRESPTTASRLHKVWGMCVGTWGLALKTT